MSTATISFVTPYWDGREMMRLHLQSLRRFFPAAPILISKKGGGRDEMEDYRSAFGVKYWLEECSYEDAMLRLLARCETELVCIVDHDTVLLSDPAPLIDGLVRGEWDLVGIEDRIRDHPAIAGARLWPDYKGWMRLAPGYTDATFLIFDLRAFVRTWGWRGIRPKAPHPVDFEFHYGICEKLVRHKYLLPYHTHRYGIGNVLKDGERSVLWHQWYGAHRQRLSESEVGDFPGARELAAAVDAGERAFLEDFPELQFSDLRPAWGPECDAIADRRAVVATLPAPDSMMTQLRIRLRRWMGYSPRKFLFQGMRWLQRQWRLR